MKKYINYPGNPSILKPDLRATSKNGTIAKEWASQFQAKQLFKFSYGELTEKTLKLLCKSSKSRQTKASVITLIESRIDLFLFRSGYASSIKHARHLIKQGSISINLLPLRHSNLFLNIGDSISISQKNKKKKTLWYTQHLPILGPGPKDYKHLKMLQLNKLSDYNLKKLNLYCYKRYR